ncbi:MAG: DUF5004 domain-containing protein [Bacteroidetes bacterium]|nr:DUF5004 domain-containing protein [Bacteroidota bacterium]
MKSILNFLLLIILFSASFISCRPKKFSDIGLEPSKSKGLQANWILSHAYVIDEAATSPDKLDITAFYQTKALPTLIFTETTFTALTLGTVKNYFGSGSGTWSFDNNDYPTSLRINYSNNVKDTFLLGGTIRPTDSTLKLKKTFYYYKKGVKNIAYSYIWEFVRQ